MCLAEYGIIDHVIDAGRAIVRFGDDSTREVSLAVLIVEGTTVVPGDRVMVSIGMALEHEPNARTMSMPVTTRPGQRERSHDEH